MSQPEVAILGLGLIGGSIGLALRQAEPNFKVIGHDKDRSVAKKALKLGAIEKEEWNLIAAVEEADLVIIATPVAAIKEIFEATAPYLKTDCVITDTSSVKEKVLKWAEELLPDTVHFVGGNPIVNKDETGIDAATADLFRKSTYCIVPSVAANPAAIELVTGMVRILGAEPFFLDPAEHDGQVAGVEHLPLVAASALLATAVDAPSSRDMRRLASSSFSRVTHLPPTEPKNYRDIVLANRENISHWIDMYIDNLTALQGRLAAADADEWWEKFFTELMETRNRWLERRFIAGEEATAQALQDIGSFRSLSSMIGLSQVRDFKEKLEKRERK